MLGAYYPGLLYFGESGFALLDPYSGGTTSTGGFYDYSPTDGGDLSAFDPDGTGNYSPSSVNSGEYVPAAIDDAGEYV